MQRNIQWRFPKRFIIVLMIFFGYVNFFYLHTNIGMAAVQMTSVRKIVHGNGTIAVKPQYDWNTQEKALVLGSFAYGRLLGPIGGVFAAQIGGSTLYAIGTLVTALITVSSPFFLEVNFYLFIIATALTGTFESFSYASVSQLWSRWITPDERAKCISFAMIGIYGGPIVSFAIAGWLLNEFGWEMLFYVSGVASIIWSFVWILTVKNDPSEDKSISQEEREYIEDRLNNNRHNDKLVYPWKDILTSGPFWVACSCKFSAGCGYTFTTMCLPQYFKDTSDIDIKQIGYISLMPQLCSVISMPLVGCFSSYIRTNKILSKTNGHRLNISIGLLFGALAFVVTGLSPNFTVCIICMSFYQFFCTFLSLDIQVLLLDIAPRYAAFMNSVANSFYTVSGFLTPILVGFIVTSHNQYQWSICFLTISTIFLFEALLFLRFCSGELQPWANFTTGKNQKQ